MGLFTALIALLLSALIWWLLGGSAAGLTSGMLWGMGIVSVAGLIPNIVYGHRGFGGRGNTDAMIYIAIVGIAAAVLLPAARG